MTDTDRAMNDWLEAEREIQKENESVLEIVKSKVSSNLFDDVTHYLKELDAAFKYEITTKEPGERYKQSESYNYLKESWVNQYCNGGYAGDDFAGQVWIRLNKTEWFTFHYSC